MFITLSGVVKNAPTITIEDRAARLLQVLPKGTQILVVTEFHKRGDYHYHVYLNMSETKVGGYSKNTYKKDIREILPEFPGRILDIQGVKSVNNTLDYILKEIDLPNLLAYSKDQRKRSPALFCTCTLESIFKRTKYGKDFAKIYSIMPFKDKTLHIQKNLNTAIQWSKSPRSMEALWQIKNRAIRSQEALILLEQVRRTRVEEYLHIQDKYSILFEHQIFLRKVLWFMLNRENYYPIATKQKNLLVYGWPNTGKTSLLTKLRTVLGNEGMFLFLGGRPNDFSGYIPGNSPILVFDDILKHPLNWTKSALLKVLAHEPFIADVKYSPQIIINPTNSIILTNDYNLFTKLDHANFNIRLTRIVLRESVNWVEIPDQDFMKLCWFILEDLIISLDNSPGLSNFIKYGVIYDVLYKHQIWANKAYYMEEGAGEFTHLTDRDKPTKIKVTDKILIQNTHNDKFYVKFKGD